MGTTNKVQQRFKSQSKRKGEVMCRGRWEVWACPRHAGLLPWQQARNGSLESGCDEGDIAL